MNERDSCIVGLWESGLYFNYSENIVTMKVSDYIFSELSALGIKDVFTVSGGAAMHLLDSLGTNKEINYCLAANFTSPSWTVFLPECFAILDDWIAISSVISVRISVKVSMASAETLLAPAFINILPKGALGITIIFLAINTPYFLRI